MSKTREALPVVSAPASGSGLGGAEGISPVAAADPAARIPAAVNVEGVERALPGSDREGLSLGRTFSALRHRNYRLWFVGQTVSLMGTWMQTTAQGYLVYELTHSPAYLGYVGFAIGAPAWLFMLYGGVVADRIARRKLLVITQACMMALAVILAALTFLGVVAPWHIVALACLLGVANAFDAPARQAFVLEMVAREDLTNAIALNSTMFNAATALGPAIAGVAYAALGPGWCFAVNAASFLAVIVALLMMRLERPVERRQGSALRAAGEAMRYVVGQRAIRTIMAVMVVTSMFGLSFATLVPAWAVNMLGGDATTNGFLQAARGVGALSAALMIAAMGRIRRKGRLLTVGTFVYPGLLLAFAATRWLPLSLLLLVGVGWGLMVLFNMANALIQSLVPDELRGRVLSIYTLSFFGFMPAGALIAGFVADHVGEQLTVVVGAAVALGFAVAAWVRVPRLRELE